MFLVVDFIVGMVISGGFASFLVVFLLFLGLSDLIQINILKGAKPKKPRKEANSPSIQHPICYVLTLDPRMQQQIGLFLQANQAPRGKQS